jgi:hypothetical protein
LTSKYIFFFLFLGLFEHKKGLLQANEMILRDYRVTFDPAIMTAFKMDMASVGFLDKIIQPAVREFVPPAITVVPNITPGQKNAGDERIVSICCKWKHTVRCCIHGRPNMIFIFIFFVKKKPSIQEL